MTIDKTYQMGYYRYMVTQPLPQTPSLKEAPMFTPNSYFLASGLIGFQSTALRVKVLRFINDDQVIVVTADLLDAGTTLCLSGSQLTPTK